ncbi:MAG: hypothetical protein M0Z33_04625 [Actinomycetota bacterium]|nr:hypothetical protein [Actinomycetota bacterium]
MLRSRNRFVPGCTAETAAAEDQVIVAAEVTNAEACRSAMAQEKLPERDRQPWVGATRRAPRNGRLLASPTTDGTCMVDK